MRFAPSHDEQRLLNDLPKEERFHYAIPRICECEEVWGLGDENGWEIRDADDKSIISIWPYRQLAMEYAESQIAENEAISVSLEYFLYSLIKQCQDNGITFEVCPAPNEKGYLLEAAELYEVLDSMIEAETYFVEG